MFDQLASLQSLSYRRLTSDQRSRLRASSRMSPLTKAEIDSPSESAICWTIRLWNGETRINSRLSMVPTMPFRACYEFRQKPRCLASSRISRRRITDVGSSSALAILRSTRSCLNERLIVNLLGISHTPPMLLPIVVQMIPFVKPTCVGYVNLDL